MKNKILVGATFRDAAQDQIDWLDLQLKFLEATTCDGHGKMLFDHVSYVNWDGKYAPKERHREGDIEQFDSRNTKIIGLGGESVVTAASPTSQQHVNSLNAILQYFREEKDNYEYFLFLDNDAFPIRISWVDDLTTKMKEQGKDIAVAIRTENLETRWHASILLSDRIGLNSLSFRMELLGLTNLLGEEEYDVTVGGYQHDLKGRVWPLIRTNQINIHPVAYGIYFDMFYHHTFGGMRHIRKGRNTHAPWDTLRYGRSSYATQYIDENYPWEEYNEMLKKDPTGFVSKLAGWNLDRYATFDV